MRLEYEVCRKAALIVLQGHHKILIDFKMAHLQYIEGIQKLPLMLILCRKK